MTLVYLLLPAALLVASVVISVLLVRRGTPAKRAMAIHFLSLIVISALCFALPLLLMGGSPLLGAAAAPEEGADGTSQSETVKSGMTDKSIAYISAALAVGIGTIGGGIAVASAAPAAIGATAEDPKNFGKSIIFVALGEGFGLYGLLIAILILVL